MSLADPTHMVKPILIPDEDEVDKLSDCYYVVESDDPHFDKIVKEAMKGLKKKGKGKQGKDGASSSNASVQSSEVISQMFRMMKRLEKGVIDRMTRLEKRVSKEEEVHKLKSTGKTRIIRLRMNPMVSLMRKRRRHRLLLCSLCIASLTPYPVAVTDPASQLLFHIDNE